MSSSEDAMSWKNAFAEYRGRRVLVTGASSGIGAAVATAFGECGARVGVHYHTGEAGARAVARAIEAGGGEAVLLQADLGGAAGAELLAGEAAARLDGVDVLVNNAGTIFARTPFAETDDAFYQEMFDLNVRSVVALTRALLPVLVGRENPVIVNTTSLAGRTGGGPGTVLYAATKGALNSLTIGLAKELGPKGIRVNAVAPGMVDTPLHDGRTSKAVMERVAAQVPLGRLGTAEDCVGAFLFLASSRLAGYVSGAVIEVGGGRV
jgi:3-oxoacyl-[acyl-carrier protein] reductase